MTKAWFPLNVSVIATNRSCLLVQTLLRFAGFYRQPSLGLLRGLLYLEVCKSRSASSIELEIPTFPKVLIFSCFEFALFFGWQKIYFVSYAIGFYRSQSQHIVAQASQALAKVQHLQLCCELAGFCCEGWDCLWSLVSIHRETSKTIVRPSNTCMETRLNPLPVTCCRYSTM